MQIGDLFRQYTNAGTQSEPITKKKGVERFSSSISGLEKGNVFEGTVNSVKGNRIELGLSNGQVINARMDAKMTLLPGESMFFQVKANNGGIIAITPFTVDGSGANFTLLEALKTAGLPTEPNFVNMVDKMMEEKMPIDRNSLNNMARIIIANPNIDVSTMVQMEKLGLPITREFASQFENYLNDKQSISSAMEQFIEQLTENLGNEDLSLEQLRNIGSNILKIVTDGLSEELPVHAQGEIQGQQINIMVSDAVSVESNVAQQTESVLGVEDKVEDIIFSEDENLEETQGDKISLDLEQTEEESSSTIQNGEVANKISSGKDNILTRLFGGNKTQEMTINESELKLQQSNKNESSVVNSIDNSVGNVMSKVGIEILNRQFQEIIEKNTDSEQGENYQEVSDKDSVVSVLNKVLNMLENNPHLERKELLDLFQGKEIKAMIKDSLEQQWTLKPEQLQDSDKINKLYEHLNEQLDKMENIIKASGQPNANILEMVANIKDNVSFMNQINEAYTYVQIPLKMSGQNASGELYVYTNKKNINSNESELTAFLHLDLDNLGSTDVSVKLFKKDVATNFYFDNDESYELVKTYLPMLEEKLKKKGYNCKLKVINEEKKVNFVQDFLKRDTPSVSKVHRYSFDMRA